MNEQERINQQLQRQIDTQNARIDLIGSKIDAMNNKIDMTFEELRQQREDMRRLQDRQDEERRKHDAEMREMNQRFYEKIDDNAKEFTKQLHTNFIQTMLGVGAIAVAVGGIVVAAFK